MNKKTKLILGGISIVSLAVALPFTVLSCSSSNNRVWVSNNSPTPPSSLKTTTSFPTSLALNQTSTISFLIPKGWKIQTISSSSCNIVQISSVINDSATLKALKVGYAKIFVQIVYINNVKDEKIFTYDVTVHAESQWNDTRISNENVTNLKPKNFQNGSTQTFSVKPAPTGWKLLYVKYDNQILHANKNGEYVITVGSSEEKLVIVYAYINNSLDQKTFSQNIVSTSSLPQSSGFSFTAPNKSTTYYAGQTFATAITSTTWTINSVSYNNQIVEEEKGVYNFTLVAGTNKVVLNITNIADSQDIITNFVLFTITAQTVPGVKTTDFQFTDPSNKTYYAGQTFATAITSTTWTINSVSYNNQIVKEENGVYNFSLVTVTNKVVLNITNIADPQDVITNFVLFTITAQTVPGVKTTDFQFTDPSNKTYYVGQTFTTAITSKTWTINSVSYNNQIVEEENGKYSFTLIAGTNKVVLNITNIADPQDVITNFVLFTITAQIAPGVKTTDFQFTDPSNKTYYVGQTFTTAITSKTWTINSVSYNNQIVEEENGKYSFTLIAGTNKVVLNITNIADPQDVITNFVLFSITAIRKNDQQTVTVSDFSFTAPSKAETYYAGASFKTSITSTKWNIETVSLNGQIVFLRNGKYNFTWASEINIVTLDIVNKQNARDVIKNFPLFSVFAKNGVNPVVSDFNFQKPSSSTKYYINNTFETIIASTKWKIKKVFLNGQIVKGIKDKYSFVLTKEINVVTLSIANKIDPYDIDQNFELFVIDASPNKVKQSTTTHKVTWTDSNISNDNLITNSNASFVLGQNGTFTLKPTPANWKIQSIAINNQTNVFTSVNGTTYTFFVNSLKEVLTVIYCNETANVTQVFSQNLAVVIKVNAFSFNLPAAQNIFTNASSTTTITTKYTTQFKIEKVFYQNNNTTPEEIWTNANGEYTFNWKSGTNQVIVEIRTLANELQRIVLYDEIANSVNLSFGEGAFAIQGFNLANQDWSTSNYSINNIFYGESSLFGNADNPYLNSSDAIGNAIYFTPNKRCSFMIIQIKNIVTGQLITIDYPIPASDL